mmetsp:Transcript_15120/g.48111  ORF Transcript_15120/g.48111 Transcript_15120/m.48111 type:complete len:213 (+) Transcript_15120:1635-2273(+)
MQARVDERRKHERNEANKGPSNGRDVPKLGSCTVGDDTGENDQSEAAGHLVYAEPAFAARRETKPELLLDHLMYREQGQWEVAKDHEADRKLQQEAQGTFRLGIVCKDDLLGARAKASISKYRKEEVDGRREPSDPLHGCRVSRLSDAIRRTKDGQTLGMRRQCKASDTKAHKYPVQALEGHQVARRVGWRVYQAVHNKEDDAREERPVAKV